MQIDLETAEKTVKSIWFFATAAAAVFAFGVKWLADRRKNSTRAQLRELRDNLTTLRTLVEGIEANVAINASNLSDVAEQTDAIGVDTLAKFIPRGEIEARFKKAEDWLATLDDRVFEIGAAGGTARGRPHDPSRRRQ